MRKLLSMALVIMLSMMFSTAALAKSDTKSEAAKKPVRLARLPMIMLSAAPDADTLTGLELKISRAVHLPLNGTLNAIEYIPSSEAAEELQDVWKKIHKRNKKARLQDAMEPLAKKLDADIVVCPILRRFSQEMMIGSALSDGGENRIISNAEVELIVYEREKDEITSKKEAQSYNGEEATYGTARFLAEDCLVKVIEQTQLRDKVLSYTPISSRQPIERKVIE